MLLLLIFAFLSGLITILTPCIWPILPIVLSTTIGSTSHKKPLGVTLGVMLSFGFFTLLISSLVANLHVDPNMLRLIAVVVIAFLGLTLLLPSLNNFIESAVSRLSSAFGQNSNSKRDGFGSGFVTGLSLGIVWSPCAGPILAAIATLAATNKISLELFLITFFYVLGAGIPLFLFAYGGQTFFSKTRFISNYTAWIQKFFGIVMILTAVVIYKNYDTLIQAKILDLFPQYNNLLNNFGDNPQVKKQLDILRGSNTTASSDSSLPNLGVAPDFNGGTKWLNSDNNIKLSDLKGKVVLVDFWTYTCINCIRTLPHVTSWYDKYKDEGFVVIGVHTPEFAFEHETDNVINAIKQFNIHYPVVQDNNYEIWNNYSNQYWPAEYLIDSDGNIRHTHFGEGEYDTTEQLIVQLLKENGKKVQIAGTNMPDQTPTSRLSPETYLGSKRMEFLSPGGSVDNGLHNFQSSEPRLDSFSFGGLWNIYDEQAVAGGGSAIQYNFSANKVYLVITPKSTEDKVKVYLDGKIIDQRYQGSDVANGQVILDKPRLYNLIDLHNHPGSHLLKLEFSDGISVFAFTFG